MSQQRSGQVNMHLSKEQVLYAAGKVDLSVREQDTLKGAYVNPTTTFDYVLNELVNGKDVAGIAINEDNTFSLTYDSMDQGIVGEFRAHYADGLFSQKLQEHGEAFDRTETEEVILLTI